MRAGACLVALALAGCHRPGTPAPDGSVPADATSSSAPVTTSADGGKAEAPDATLHPVGIQAPLPVDWSLSSAADGSLRAGPPGRGVLRVDVAPAGAGRPAPEQLAKDFESGLKGLSATVMRTEEDVGFSGVVLSVSHARGDSLASHPVFLGAKAVGGTVYLCASEPGSSLTEIARAATVCRGLVTAHR